MHSPAYHSEESSLQLSWYSTDLHQKKPHRINSIFSGEDMDSDESQELGVTPQLEQLRQQVSR